MYRSQLIGVIVAVKTPLFVNPPTYKRSVTENRLRSRLRLSISKFSKNTLHTEQTSNNALVSTSDTVFTCKDYGYRWGIEPLVRRLLNSQKASIVSVD
jgi:hypothetical protein